MKKTSAPIPYKGKTNEKDRAGKWYGLKKVLLMGCMLVSGALRAQPVITSLSATSGAPGSSVTITGSGFNTTAASNAVYFGPTKATVTGASATSLAVTVPLGAANTPVTVTNTGTALSGTSRQVFSPTFDNSAYIPNAFNFEAKVDFPPGGGYAYRDMALEDIDGDGKTDMIRLGYTTTAELVIVRNLSTAGPFVAPFYPATGSFSNPVSFALLSPYYPASSKGFVVADLDGDGKKDIVVSVVTGGFSVFRNTATPGSLTSSSLSARVDFSGSGNGMLAISDFNGDGKPDIVQVNTDDNHITVYQNTTSGATVSFAAGIDFATGEAPSIVKVADIDGDGKQDIVTNNGSAGFSIFRNIASSGAITASLLDARVDYSASYEIADIVFSDIDGDGKRDIIAAAGIYSYYTPSCTIYRNNTTSGSILASSFSGTEFNFGRFGGVGDMDGDGKPDIIGIPNIGLDYADPTTVPNYVGNWGYPGYTYAFSSNGDGIAVYRNVSTSGSISSSSFAAGVKFYDLDGVSGFGGYTAEGTSLMNILAADMDMDGKQDIVVMQEDFTGILRNNPLKAPPTVSALSAYSGNPGSTITITGSNFNSTSANNSVYFGATKGTVTSASATSLAVTVPVGATFEQVSVANTTLGLMATSSKPFLPSFDHSAYVAGTINFDPKVDLIAESPAGALVKFGDVDGDGKADMLYRSGSSVFVRRNISTSGSITTGSFASPVSFAIAGAVRTDLVFGDVDMDGKADIIIGCSNTTDYEHYYVSVLKNTATSGIINSASFAAHVDFELGTNVDLVATGDVDGDGRPEIIFSTGSSGPDHWLSMLQNRCAPGIIDAGSFAPPVTLAIEGYGSINQLKMADVDGDGKNDIIITASYEANGKIYRNTSRMGAITGIAPIYMAHTNSGLLISFAPAVNYGSELSYISAEIGDIDGDGKPDVVFSDDSSFIVRRNISTPGTIELADPVYFGYNTTYGSVIKLGDMDGDGKPDVIRGYGYVPSTPYFVPDSGVLVFRNIATSGSVTSGSFAPPKSFKTGGIVFGMAIEDIDGDGKSDIITASETYTDPRISMLRNNPERIEGPDNVCIGSTITLTDGVITGTWSSSNTAVATVGAATGIVTGIASGTTVISYSFSGGMATKIVTVGAMPASITGTLTVCQAATTTLSNAITGGTWSSSNISVATVGSSTGVVTGVGGGTAVITYFTGCTGGATAIVTVNPLPGLSPIYGDATACIGATTTLSNSYSGGVWSSADPAIASIDASTGILTPLVSGTVNITYTGTNSCGTVSVNRLQTVNILPSPISGSFTVCVGSTTTLSSTPTGGVWTSYTTANATIGSASGIVTGVHTGTSFILYALNGCYATKTVTINAASTGAGTVTGTAVVCAGATTTLSNTVSGGSWASSATGVATVGTGGIVTGVAAGTAIISYVVTTSCGSGAATKIVTVNPAPDAGVITGAAVVCTGSTATLSNAISGGTWSSGTPSVASVGSSTGVIAGVTSGTAVITYTVSNSCGTATATRIVTVNASPDAGAITGGAGVCISATATLSDAVSGGTWSSSTTSVATVGSSTGIVTGVSSGTSIISYTVTASGCGTATATKVVTVSAMPDAGTITGAGIVCVGTGTLLSNSVTGGVWSSGSAHATIGSDGSVLGISSGTAMMSYTVANSCSTAIATHLITIDTVPDAGTISGITTACTGATTTLSDPVPGGFWISNPLSVATVSTSGVVTGVTAGTAIITYMVFGTCGTGSATRIVTITTTPPTGTITGTPTVCTGGTTTLSSSVSGGTWLSAVTVFATVDNVTGVVTGISPGTVSIFYIRSNSCGSSSSSISVTVSPTPAAGTITGSGTVCASGTTALSNTVGGGSWSSSNTSIATVNSAGVVTGVSTGTVTISYSISASCGTAVTTKIVTVNAAPAAGTISGPSSVTVGSSVTFTDGISGGTWSASNSNATVSSAGIVTGISAGTVTISYTVTNSCGTAVATKVITVGTSLGAIMGTFSTCAGFATGLSHASPGGWWGSSNVAVATISTTGMVTGVAAGTATVTYSLGGSSVAAVVTVNPLPATISGAANVCLGATTTLSDVTTGGTWSSNNASIASADMSTGVVAGISVGTTTITYTLPTGCYRTLNMTVKPLPAAITGAASLCPGSTTTYSDATTGGVSWSSSNPSAGTIGAVSGVFTAIATGTTTITYTVTSGCTATKTVSVNAIPATIGGTLSACAGSTAILTNTTTGGTWSSSVPGAATIGSSTGVVTAVAAGVTNIIYSTGAGCNRSATFTVNPLPAVIAGSTTLCAGSTTTLTDVTTGGTWTSGSTSVATVSAAGIVTGISTGTSVITYALGTGCSRTATVNVSGSISAITGTLSTCIGSSTALANATSGGTWSSSNPVIATVSTSGLVTGMATGIANITYAVASCRAVATVTVAASIPAITGTPSVCINATTALSNTVTGGTWSSSNPALGTVSASGVVTGIAAGMPTITYSAGSCYRVLNVTVKPLPGAISGNTGICIGGTSTVTDGTGLSWASSTPSVATIGAASGVITGVSAGTSTITFNATNGCIATKVVTVDAPPTVLGITGPAGVAIGHTITLASATPGGIWSSNNTAKATVSAGGVVTGIAVPAATISYTKTNGVCSISVTKLISITTSRPGLAENEQGAEVHVYPNPTTGRFTVQTSVGGTFTVYTLEGKEVQRTSVNAGANQLSLAKELAAGIYMCRFSGDDNSTVMVRMVYEH